MASAGVVAMTVAACGSSTHHVSAKTRTSTRGEASRPVPTTPIVTTTTSTITPPSAAAGPSVVACLKRARLGHVTATSSNRWQGVIGDHPLSDEVASVFVVGPYSSAAAVRRAVPTVGQGENAAAGGLYLLVGTTAGHTAKPIASAAACLRPSATSRASKRPKSYKF
jgi:hypothetical protein